MKRARVDQRNLSYGLILDVNVGHAPPLLVDQVLCSVKSSFCKILLSSAMLSNYVCTCKPMSTRFLLSRGRTSRFLRRTVMGGSAWLGLAPLTSASFRLHALAKRIH